MTPSDFIPRPRALTRSSSSSRYSELANDVALRGGTALHKLIFSPARRYSEDIDLVQLQPAPIGPTMDQMCAKLDRWLGSPKRERGEGMRLI